MKTRIQFHLPFTAAALAALGTLTGGAFAGPLTPPGGPIEPSYRTLDQVEPRVMIGGPFTQGDANNLFIISSPGSYYLIGSVSASSGRSFLRVTASNVTIDMAGFRASGQSGSVSGIVIAPGVENVRILNGSLVGFGHDGVDAADAIGVRIQGVTAVGVGKTGFRVGPSGILSDCVSLNAGNSGFILFGGAVAERCTAKGSGFSGFTANGAASFRDCTARENTHSGFSITNGASVERCTAIGNSQYGVQAIINSQDTRVIDCMISNNILGGIQTHGSAMIRGNSVTGANANALIQLMGSGNRVESNQTRGNGAAVSVAAGSQNNFILCNTHNSNGTGVNGFAGIPAASNVLGPVVTTNAGVSSANAWANFTR